MARHANPQTRQHAALLRSWLSAYLALTFLAVAALPASAADGDLDLTFGTGGMVSTDFGGGADVAEAVVQQADGKLVVAGPVAISGAGDDFGLARYNTDGTLDTSFGTGGKVNTQFGIGYDRAYALAVQPDGKLVAAGYAQTFGASYDNFGLVRYNPDGSLDATFGSGGKVVTDFDFGVDTARALVVQTDGKLVAAGSSRRGGYTFFALARYNQNGSLDTGFGTGGKVSTDFFPGDDFFEALVVQPDGKLVAAGRARNPATGGFDFALVRYNPNGTLDAGFGSGGLVVTHFGFGSDYANALVLQPDGKLVAAGHAWGQSTGDDYALARYNTDGTLDATFGSGGLVTAHFGTNFDFGHALVQQLDGKLIIGGYATNPANGNSSDVVLVRYDEHGVPDAGFGTGGTLITHFGSHEKAFALLRQSDGNLVVAGAIPSSGFDNFLVARYLVSTQPPNTAPVANDQTVTGNEDTAIGIVLDADDADNDALAYEILDGPDSGALAGTAPNLTYSPNADFHGSDSFTFRVNDGAADSNVATVSITVYPVNDAPVIAAAQASVTVDEGQAAANNGTFGDVDGDALSLSASVGVVTDNGDGTWSWSYVTTDGPANDRTVTITAGDGAAATTASFALAVTNVAPSISSVSVSPLLVQVSDAVQGSAAFSDPGTGDTHTAEWNWGDVSVPSSAVASGTVGPDSHAYTDPGVYTVQLTLSDDEDASDTASAEEYVVVYDPSAGFVTGNGWIQSPAGAYTLDPALAGTARFGFVSKYQKGQTVPGGNTQFEFKTAAFEFRSTGYEWLVVAGSKAMFKGAGTVNGAGSYGFLLSVIDGAPDKFRIKIWNKDMGDSVVYDNQLGAADDASPATAISSGQIVIHTNSGKAANAGEGVLANAVYLPLVGQ